MGSARTSNPSVNCHFATVSEFLANPLPGPLTLGAADNDRSFGVQDVAP